MLFMTGLTCYVTCFSVLQCLQIIQHFRSKGDISSLWWMLPLRTQPAAAEVDRRADGCHNGVSNSGGGAASSARGSGVWVFEPISGDKQRKQRQKQLAVAAAAAAAGGGGGSSSSSVAGSGDRRSKKKRDQKRRKSGQKQTLGTDADMDSDGSSNSSSGAQSDFSVATRGARQVAAAAQLI
jgi:hypothetical protein